MSSLQILTEKHNLINETIFRVKSSLLIINRHLKDFFSTAKRFSDKGKISSLPVIAISESNLWDPDDTNENWILTAGKIQNLRLAAKRLNGIEVDANEDFSFWKHIGNPNTRKGYVIGREIREGCIMPTVAGGLCQLTNALYDAALRAGFHITERHRHTKIIKGSLAEQDRDATVKWNYLDLRFKADQSFRIEIELTTDRLIVKFRGMAGEDKNSAVKPSESRPASTLNDCYSCGNFECHRNPELPARTVERGVTTFILDQRWKELDEYIRSNSTEADFYIVPFVTSSFLKTSSHNWNFPDPKQVKTVAFAALKRAFLLRWAAKTKKNIFLQQIRLDKKVASAAAKIIPVESTHLVVSQNLLPFLWEQGIFGGRTFDVLMNRLPMQNLHERLDRAFGKFPDSTTLNDFRAPQQLIEAENIALTKAGHIITPHQEVAGIFNNKSIKLDWAQPKVPAKRREPGKKILFPASALGRKGAYEVKRLTTELDLPLVIAGKASEYKDFWKGSQVAFAQDDIFMDIGLVVYPAYVEHQPRMVLKALSLGMPVIATSACGLSPMENLIIVPIGDYESLKQCVMRFISTSPSILCRSEDLCYENALFKREPLQQS